MKNSNSPRFLRIIGLIISIAIPVAHGATPAFPGAEGGGSLTLGGRGGAVIEVTNLNDSGAGSLRSAVTAAGARTIVFRVGGTIVLQTGLLITNPYITIAGQTAPGGGIQIVGPLGPAGQGDHCIVIRTHDVILRYLRIRHGRNPSNSYDTPTDLGLGVSAEYNTYNLVVDHCSIAWAENKAFGMWGSASGSVPYNITVSYNICAETFKGHSTSLITGANSALMSEAAIDIDFHHNLTMSCTHRHPLLKNKSTRLVNNLVYNWYRFATMLGGGVHADIIRNIYKRGPMLNPLYHPAGSGRTFEVRAYVNGLSGPAGNPSVYLSGNIGINDTVGNNNWAMTREVLDETNEDVGPMPTAWSRSTPLSAGPNVPITAHPTATLESLLLPTVGAYQRLDASGNWVGNRDILDAVLVNDYVTSDGPDSGNIPANETEGGGFPALAAGTPFPDTDHDGMSDSWEVAKFGNLARTGTGDLDGDGYTDLEEFLNGTPPGPSGPLDAGLLVDDFEDGAAGGWTPTGGAWSVVTDGSKVYFQSSSTSGQVSSRATSFAANNTDYAVEARVKVSTYGSNGTASLQIRKTDANNYYYMLLGPSQVTLKKRVAGVVETLQPGSHPINAGTWYTIRLEADGQNIRGFVNGILVASAGDASLASGWPELAAYNTSVKFDDVVVSLRDNFEDGNAAGWTTAGGTWSIVADGSNTYAQTSVAGGAFSTYRGSASWSNYLAEARMKVTTWGTNASAQLQIRRTNADNYYYLVLNGSQVVLKKRVAGMATTLQTVTYPVNTGTWYTVRLRALGAAIEGYINGELVVYAADDLLTAGYPALAGQNVAVRFDDVIFR